MNASRLSKLRVHQFSNALRHLYLHRPVCFAPRYRVMSTNTSVVDPALLLASQPIEEELLPGYVADNYYPVQIGQVFDAQYKILCKLGQGTGSQKVCGIDGGYRALKVCTIEKNGHLIQQSRNEMAVLDYLKSSPVQKHPGKTFVRGILDSFEIPGPKGLHMCLVYNPLGMTFTELRNRMPEGRFEPRMLQGALQILLISLDYLHKNSVVHTDISPNNLLCGANDMAPFEQLEKSEQAQASIRKVLGDRTIYLSRQTPKTDGDPILADLGSARFGKEQYQGDIMPLVYRAPEVILGMECSSKVDIWSVGVMVCDLLEGKRLFLTKNDGANDDEQHLAEMVAFIGPPPVEFLQRSERCARYFDESGNWRGSIPVPTTTLEERVTQVDGQDKELMLGFVRHALRWLPEEWPPADELVYDDWLMQRYSELDA
ncbi:hypothetical protein MY1884_002798 [Beauveria asiatica]